MITKIKDNILVITIVKLFSELKTFIIKQNDSRIERPSDNAVIIISIIGWPIYLFGGIFILSLLLSVTTESAKWALSAQVQATAAILGLLIAAIALLWRRISSQEDMLRNRIYVYLRLLGQSEEETPHGGTTQILDLVYEKVLKAVNDSKEKKQEVSKQVLADLGRLWTMKTLTTQYRVHTIVNRRLTWYYLLLVGVVI